MYGSKSWLCVCLTVTAGLVGGALSGRVWSIDASAAARQGKTVGLCPRIPVTGGE
jgi:hypothetical protein